MTRKKISTGLYMQQRRTNPRGFEMAMGWVIAIVIGLIVLGVVFVLWRVLYNAVSGLPG